MEKTLVVKIPFSTLKKGDVFKLTKDKKFYSCESKQDYTDKNVHTRCQNETIISVKYAEHLTEEGYLECEKDSKFVNIFDEIDRLLNAYDKELSEIPDTMKDSPECLKVEKHTVLSNLIKVLTYLKNLKK